MEDRSSRRMRALVTQMAAGGLSANEIARALISMMARSTKTLQSKAGYIDARPHIPQLEEVLLQPTAGPYIWVIFVGSARSRHSRFVRFAPKADIASAPWLRYRLQIFAQVPKRSMHSPLRGEEDHF